MTAPKETQPTLATIKVDRAALTDAVNNVTRLTTSRHVEHKQLHFTVTPDALQIATQNDTSKLRLTVPASTTDTHSFRIPSGILGDILSNMRAEEVTLEATGTELIITADKHRANLRAHTPPTEEEEITFPETTSESTLTGEDITHMLEHTMSAIAKGEHHSLFRSILLHFSPQYSRAVGSDGFRLSYRNAPPVEVLGEKNVLLPGKQAEHLLRNFPTGSIRLHATDAEVTFQTDTATFTTKVEDGQYPEYERIIPSSFVCRFEVNVPDFLAALNRASIFTEEESNYRVQLHMQMLALTITGETNNGVANETVPITILENDDTVPTIAINSRFLRDALKPIEGEATISISGATSPLVITPADNNDYVSVIVPLTTDA